MAKQVAPNKLSYGDKIKVNDVTYVVNTVKVNGSRVKVTAINGTILNIPIEQSVTKL